MMKIMPKWKRGHNLFFFYYLKPILWAIFMCVLISYLLTTTTFVTPPISPLWAKWEMNEIEWVKKMKRGEREDWKENNGMDHFAFLYVLK